MKYYEPYQRLDQFVYVKTENSAYVKSSVSVLMPAGTSLLGKDPVHNSALTATIEYLTIADNSATESYIIEQPRLIKFMDRVPIPDISMDINSLKAAVSQAIAQQLGKTGFYTVTCKVYNEKNAVGGQVTNTISQQGEVIIL